MFGAAAGKIVMEASKVVRAADRATYGVLKKFGAFVRRTARQSIRKRKKVSAPGKPPTSRTGLLKKTIIFNADPDRRNVIIGPMKLNRRSEDAPFALEHGGMATIVRGSPTRPRRERKYIKARPFMGPAMDENLPKLPGMWRDSIK